VFTIAEASKGGTPGRGKSTPRMEGELDRGAKEESRGALWQRSAEGSIVTRIRVVHPGNNSDLQ